MKIFSISSDEEVVLYNGYKKNSDERLVRRELVDVWIRYLEKYARPGMEVPPVDEVRRELIRMGVDAGVDALVDEHWVYFSFMFRNEVQERIEAQLDRFDLADFLEDVKEAQNHPERLECLRDGIRHFVMEDPQ